jgi:hypothetical protein
MVRIQHTVPLRVSAILTVLKDAHSRARFPVLNVALASADRDASHRKLQVLGEMGQSGEKIPDTWRMSGFCGAERVEKFSRGHTNTTSFPADSAESEAKGAANRNRRIRRRPIAAGGPLRSNPWPAHAPLEGRGSAVSCFKSPQQKLEISAKRDNELAWAIFI